MAHKPFNLYRRPTRNGRSVFYVQFYDDADNRLTAKSTGQTSKAAAEAWAYEQLKNGRIITRKNITFGQYANDWWLWDKCLLLFLTLIPPYRNDIDHIKSDKVTSVSH